jgi:hypothetical protein
MHSVLFCVSSLPCQVPKDGAGMMNFRVLVDISKTAGIDANTLIFVRHDGKSHVGLVVGFVQDCAVAAQSSGVVLSTLERSGVCRIVQWPRRAPVWCLALGVGRRVGGRIPDSGPEQTLHWTACQAICIRVQAFPFECTCAFACARTCARTCASTCVCNVRARVHAGVRVHAHVRVRVHVGVRVPSHVCVCVCVCMCMCMCVSVFVHMCVCVYMCACMCMCAYVFPISHSMRVHVRARVRAHVSVREHVRVRVRLRELEKHVLACVW